MSEKSTSLAVILTLIAIVVYASVVVTIVAVAWALDHLAGLSLRCRAWRARRRRLWKTA